jgi:hypothetical protein
MSQPLPVPALSSPQVWFPKKHSSPLALTGDPQRGRQSSDSFFKSRETPDVVVRLRAIATVNAGF